LGPVTPKETRFKENFETKNTKIIIKNPAMEVGEWTPTVGLAADQQ
jgi:hypothetical protein